MKRIIAVALVMMASPAFAQNVEPLCFEVVPIRSGVPVSAILVDKCTGHTWAFAPVVDAGKTVGVYWSPVRIEPYRWDKNGNLIGAAVK